MKNKLTISLSRCFLWLLAILCSSCNQKSDPEPTTEEQLAIVKIGSDMYENVFVSPVVDSVHIEHSKGNVYTLYNEDSLALCNLAPLDTLLSEFAQSQFNIIGKSPYIVLDNGYAIIDWKWSYFQALSGAYRETRYTGLKTNAQHSYSTNAHYSNGELANEEYYLLSVKWLELSKLLSNWNISDGLRIEKPEIYYVNLSDIEKYGDYQMTCREISTKYNVTIFDFRTVYNLYLRDVDKFKEYVKECDHLQTQYTETLNRMIKNNDLGTWKQH